MILRIGQAMDYYISALSSGYLMQMSFFRSCSSGFHLEVLL